MSSSEIDRGVRPPVGDYVLAGVIAALSVTVIVAAFLMPRAEGWSQSPGLFPLISGVGLLAMAAILAFAAWRGRTIVEAPATDSGQPAEEEPVDIGRTLLVAASILVYALVLVPLLGYRIATLVYLLAAIWYFWRGNLLVIAAISIGATVFLSETFQRAFSIILP